MQVKKLHTSLVALIVAGVCACGQSASPGSSSSPSPAPAITLESMSAQPADLPAVGLQKCTTGLFTSGDLRTDKGATQIGIWTTVQSAGAVEGWRQHLTLACPGERVKSRVVNDLIRFKDAAAAVAFFRSEKAHARSTSIYWPLQVGTTPKEGSPTGLGPNSVSLVYTNFNQTFSALAFAALWTNGAFLISYIYIPNLVHLSSNGVTADGLKGALAVNARVPKST